MRMLKTWWGPELCAGIGGKAAIVTRGSKSGSKRLSNYGGRADIAAGVTSQNEIAEPRTTARVSSQELGLGCSEPYQL